MAGAGLAVGCSTWRLEEEGALADTRSLELLSTFEPPEKPSSIAWFHCLGP